MNELERIRDTYRGYESSGRGRLWDTRSRGYERLAADRDRQLAALIDRSLAPGGGRVLDVGCGTGHGFVITSTARPGAEYDGIDLLDERINTAAARFPAVRFQVASGDAMPFADRVFDVVLAVTLFSSLPSSQLETAVAREIARVLRPGGWLVWYDLRYDNPSNRAVHGVSRARLGELFTGWLAELEAMTLAPPIARRLGPLTPVLYPVLDAVPVLRSHLIGRLQCPG